MNFPPSLKPALWGGVIGAIAISTVGFSWMGWTLGGTAERMAAVRAQSAIVDVLTPICVARFKRQEDSAAKLIEFKKAASWNQRTIIEKGGWAAMPGTDTADTAVVSACAEKLGQPS